MMAGRNISVTHVALGTTRVQQTIALAGQAVGAAAAYAVKRRILPRDIVANHMSDFQQLLLKRDVTIPKVVNADAGDLARNAKVSVSSEQTTELLIERDIHVSSWNKYLNEPHGMILPWGRKGPLRSASFHFKATDGAPEKSQLKLHVRAANGPRLLLKPDVTVVTKEIPEEKVDRVSLGRGRAIELVWLWFEPAPGVQWLEMKNYMPNSAEVGKVDGQWRKLACIV